MGSGTRLDMQPALSQQCTATWKAKSVYHRHIVAWYRTAQSTCREEAACSLFRVVAGALHRMALVLYNDLGNFLIRDNQRSCRWMTGAKLMAHSIQPTAGDAVHPQPTAGDAHTLSVHGWRCLPHIAGQCTQHTGDTQTVDARELLHIAVCAGRTH